jgi:hypothetical protein
VPNVLLLLGCSDLFNAMADKEVFQSGEELLERKLVCKEGEHAQSPYKAKFDLLADAGGYHYQ